jgi:hypothetical protein
MSTETCNQGLIDTWLLEIEILREIANELVQGINEQHECSGPASCSVAAGEFFVAARLNELAEERCEWIEQEQRLPPPLAAIK